MPTKGRKRPQLELASRPYDPKVDRLKMKLKPVIAGMLALGGLAGCATYQPKPLDLHPTSLHAVPHITVGASKMPLPELRSHPFDPAHGLDMTDVAILAVVRNPDLKLARDDAHIAYAQAFAAGLLPEPQFAAETDTPGPGYSSAFNFGLSWNIGSLLYASRQHDAAKLAARQTDLNLLWQEWQVVAQARTLFAQNVMDRQLLKLQIESRNVLQSRYGHTQAALAKGLITTDVAMADLAALAAVQSQIHSTEIDLNAKHSQLTALLDLSPSVELNLRGPAQLPPLDGVEVRALLSHLDTRRPDLLALKAGYESQDMSYRVAILQQFPDLTVGLNRQRDTSGVYSTGFLVNFTIPVHRNRGNIAVASATRQKLFDTYESRYAAARRDIDSILHDEPLLQRQLREDDEALVQLRIATANGQAAFDAGNLDGFDYVALRSSLLSKEIEIVTLKESILERNILLQSLIGSELPTRPESKE